MIKNLLKIAAGVFLPLVFATTVYASASDVSVRLTQPKSPTNQNTFDINFVTLDILDRAMTVKCYKKGPSDGGFSQFGSDIALSVGGNTGNCIVDSSIVNSAGTYQFQTTSTAAGGVDTATSSIVTVDYNSASGPDTPTNYSKEQPSSCLYKIKFKTANDDGKTVKVELYRSENTSFNADSGTRVGSLSIGSNTDGEIDNTVGDCSKTYYFAIRAFDTFGNGSSVVGDSVTTVTTTSTTTSTTTPGSPAPGTGAIALATNQTGGSVLGKKSTTANEAGNVLAESTAAASPQPGPSTAPESQKQGNSLFSMRNILIGLGILVVVFAIYFFLIRKKSQ